MMNFIEGEILLINKPLRWTSFDVVNKIRYALSQKTGVKKFKVGHAGTLDPLATGLLILCTGKMTKRIDEFMDLDKEYSGTFFLGATTPSFDAETEVNQNFSVEHLDEKTLKDTVKIFSGIIQQVPPVYSAIKVNGTAAYIKARKGKEIELKPREVTIHNFELTRIDLPEVDFIVKCSKGTYIRSLANDLGRALNSGAYLKSLCRTKIGEYDLQNAMTVEECLKMIHETI